MPKEVVGDRGDDVVVPSLRGEEHAEPSPIRIASVTSPATRHRRAVDPPRRVRRSTSMMVSRRTIRRGLHAFAGGADSEPMSPGVFNGYGAHWGQIQAPEAGCCPPSRRGDWFCRDVLVHMFRLRAMI